MSYSSATNPPAPKCNTCGNAVTFAAYACIACLGSRVPANSELFCSRSCLNAHQCQTHAVR